MTKYLCSWSTIKWN